MATSPLGLNVHSWPRRRSSSRIRIDAGVGSFEDESRAVLLMRL